VEDLDTGLVEHVSDEADTENSGGGVYDIEISHVIDRKQEINPLVVWRAHL
jgi:hypothetical protein